MAADLRKMQENQGFSENRIDKSRFCVIPINGKLSVYAERSYIELLARQGIQ